MCFRYIIILSKMTPPQDKIYDLSTLKTTVDHWKKSGESVVFTNGCFDILHQGHLDILQYSKSLGHKLVVALNTDASVQKLKGPDRPINNESLRSEIMASLYYVDAVILFGEETPLQVIETIVPDVLVKGGDYKKSEVVGADVIEAHGGEVVIFSYLEGYSTTSLIENIKKNY